MHVETLLKSMPQEKYGFCLQNTEEHGLDRHGNIWGLQVYIGPTQGDGQV